MRVAFINLSLRPNSKRKQLPVGLAYVMTAVKKVGFEFDLIDMDIVDLSFKDLEKILEEKKYDVFAFGCIVTGFRIVKSIAEIVKKINPNALIIAGNSVATSIPEILLKYSKIDIAVLGEGDITIVDLFKAINGKVDYRTVKGIAFRDNGKIKYSQRRKIEPDLDPLGFPDWDIFDLSQYNKYGKINYNVFDQETALGYPLNSARGCLFSCTFCYHVFRGEKYRRYSDNAIIEEIIRLHNKYGASFISFWDELTFPNIKHTRSLVERLGRLDFKVGWGAPCKANLFKKEDLPLVKDIKAAGCDNISFSLENASSEILAAMNKKITVKQFVEQAETLWEGGVTPLTSVVFGYPQETPETIKQTLNICEKCNIFPSVGFLLPLPGTPIYEWAKDHRFIINEVEYLERIGDRQDFHINLTTMTDEKFVETVTSELEKLAEKLGLELDSVFKTTTYQKPKTQKNYQDPA